MRKPVVIAGDGESLQDVLIQIKLRHPELKFSTTPVFKTIEKEFGEQRAEEMRKDAWGMGKRAPLD